MGNPSLTSLILSSKIKITEDFKFESSEVYIVGGGVRTIG